MTAIGESSSTAQAMPRQAMPRVVWLGLIIAIVLDTGVQLCWKGAVLAAPDNATFIQTILATAAQPLFWAALVMYGLQFLNWMRVLSHADLSFAQPITALSYVSVGACSIMFLHESITPVRALGTLLILLGVWFISQTSHKTTNLPIGDGITGDASLNLKEIAQEVAGGY
jgi:drug/metabolite transporter (DMT)-like permease